MMSLIILTVFPSLLMVGGVVAVLYPAIWLHKFTRRGKRSPLTGELLRSPGESLRAQIDDLNFDINGLLLLPVLLPLALYAYFITLVHFTKGKISSSVLYLFVIILACVLAFLIWKVSKAFSRRNDLRLGLDAEMAVGQELNQLMRQGCAVYHDFPADNFNIDHIVIGPNGVFAVETKGRAKPTEKGDKKNWSVVFDGQTLQFPNWTEREYLPQARRQAEWLTKWLSSAVGESVNVRPVLVMPGWWIDQKKPSDVILFNGKNPISWAGTKAKNPLSDAMIQRIAHQIEQKCRDVEPAAYKKEKKSN